MNTPRPINLLLIDPPTNAHRIDMDEDAMAELCESIAEVGLINPITVTQNGDRYTVVAGHRRYLAHMRLGKPQIMASLIADDARHQSDQMQFAENFQRSDLSPVEEALALNDQYQKNGNDIAAIARTVKRSIQWVEQRLALLDLPDDLGPLVHTRRLPIGSALALAQVTDEQHRAYLTTYAIDAGATVPTIRRWVDTWKMETAANPNAPVTQPTMPTPGEQPRIEWPCWSCHQPYPAVHMLIKHVCPECAKQLSQVTA